MTPGNETFDPVMLMQVSFSASAEFTMAQFKPFIHHLRPCSKAVQAKHRHRDGVIMDQHAPPPELSEGWIGNSANYVRRFGAQNQQRFSYVRSALEQRFVSYLAAKYCGHIVNVPHVRACGISGRGCLGRCCRAATRIIVCQGEWIWYSYGYISVEGLGSEPAEVLGDADTDGVLRQVLAG